MRISDWSSDVCSSDLHPVDSATSAILNGIPRSRRRSSSAITRSLLLFISTVNGSSCGCLRLCGLSRQVFGLEDLLPVSRSEEHTSELQSLMRISYAVFCLKKKKMNITALHLK